MLNSIDKDVRLFLPQKYEFLLFAGNFLFSKRLYEIVKREYRIKRIDYKDKIEDPNRIKGLIKYYNSDTLVFTSEILLVLDNSDFDKFKQVIISLKGSENIKFVFVEISNPLKKYVRKNYHSRIQQIENILDLKKDIVYEFPSFLTYVDSNIERNPLFLSKSKSLEPSNEIYLADDIISDIVSNFGRVGKMRFKKTKNSFKHAHDYAIGQSRCALNLIYRKKPREICKNKSVADWRLKLGALLKNQIPTDVLDTIDAVVPVPETGKYYAQGLAMESNKPYLEALFKKTDVGRSFDIKNTQKRQEFIGSKLGLVDNLVKNKNLLIVDEAIFTGSTLKTVSNLFKNSGVGKIYFAIPSPECRNRCSFNMQPDRELLSEILTQGELAYYFGVQSVFFQDPDEFEKLMLLSGHDISCCFPK